MDANNDTQTQLLRDIWEQLVKVHNTLDTKIDRLSDRVDRVSDRVDAQGAHLGARIDVVNEHLGTRIDILSERIDAFMVQTHQNFRRVHRNLERVDRRSELEELDLRVTRVEEHVGLRPED